jgi:hypothetical protein
MASPVPGKYVPRFISREEISPVMNLNSIMQKLSPANFDALMTQARNIRFLNEQEGFTPDEEAVKTMKPVIDIIIKNIKICNEGDPQNKIYADMFHDLSVNWTGYQCDIFKKLMNEELEKIFAEYSSLTEIEITQRLQMYSVIAFVAKLYHLDGVSGLYIVKVLETFCKDDNKKIGIFVKLIAQTLDKLCKEPWFKGKIVAKYKQFLENYTNGDNRDSAVYYIARDVLEKQWSK